MNLLVTILLGLAFVTIFCFMICKLKVFRRLGLAPKWLLLLFATKLVAAFVLVGVYRIAYNDYKKSDVFNYYCDGLVLYSAIEENPADYFKMVSGICADEPQLKHYYDKTDFWYKAWNYGLLNDNRTIIRYNAILDLFTQGNLWLGLIISAFVAFCGSYLLALAMLGFAGGRRWAAIVAAFLVPSVVFWSSGMLKECLVMFSVGLLMFSWTALWRKFGIVKLLVVLVAALLLFLTKFYVLLALLPGLVVFSVPSKFGAKKLLVSSMAVFALVVVLFFFSGKIFGYDLVDTIVKKQHDFINMVNSEANYSGSNIEIKELEPTFVSFVTALVPAYINTLLRPFVTEVDSFVKLVCCVENIVFLLLFLLMCIRFKQIDNNQFRFVLFTFCFMLVLYALIGMTTPNLGALVRYKIPVMPFMLFSILICTNFDLLKKLIRFCNKKDIDSVNSQTETKRKNNGSRCARNKTN
ncbi:MAG: hypothetical protein J5542_11760 [Bacteroidales bacterium]|nr:hypothetical protein [Bacteroidales bacterium]